MKKYENLQNQNFLNGFSNVTTIPDELHKLTNGINYFPERFFVATFKSSTYMLYLPVFMFKTIFSLLPFLITNLPF